MDPKPLKQYGLIPQEIPRTHPNTHQVFGTMSPSDIPDTLEIVDTVGPVDQDGTSFCFAYCPRQLCSDMDNILYDENWNVVATAETWGQSTENGAPALEAMQAMIYRGPLAASDAPPDMTWQLKGPPFIANPANWPASLNAKAAPHEKSSVLTVDGPYDDFDNCRAWMAAHKRGVASATQWYAGFNEPDGNGIVHISAGTEFTWHMYELMGYDVIAGTQVIKLKPHEGASYGKGGYSYIGREDFNALVENKTANVLVFGDVPQSVVNRMQIQTLSLEQIFEELAARIESAL